MESFGSCAVKLLIINRVSLERRSGISSLYGSLFIDTHVVQVFAIVMGKLNVLVPIGFFSLAVLCFTALYQLEPRRCILCPVSEKDTHQKSVVPKSGRVYACVFTGRWMFLRILLPYLYRELRQNGGVVDTVLFAMIGYNEEARVKLQGFSTAANSILKDEVFQFFYFKKDTTKINDIDICLEQRVCWFCCSRFLFFGIRICSNILKKIGYDLFERPSLPHGLWQGIKEIAGNSGIPTTSATRSDDPPGVLVGL